MKKRYQVFISSTYEDLIQERLTALNSILTINCIPVGMELFSAASEEQFSYIKKIIDKSDYYILIIGGRYGSLAKDGFSYTEKEFDYAIANNIPILAFLHKNPEDLPKKYTEQTQKNIRKYENFRKKVQTDRVVDYWSNADEISGKIIAALQKAFEDNPRPGWIRSDSIDPENSKVIEQLATLSEITKRYDNKLSSIQNEIDKSRTILESFEYKQHFYNKIKYKNTRNFNKIKNRFLNSKNKYSNRQADNYNISNERFYHEIIRACIEMSKTKTGALISIEKTIPLDENIRTGIYLDCIISSQILLNIFSYNTPLHDGVAIIRGTRIISATCYLPLSNNLHIAKGFGTRHRAGFGISEITDCVTIIISEETGTISLTYRGNIFTNLNGDTLYQKMIETLSELYPIT